MNKKNILILFVLSFILIISSVLFIIKSYIDSTNKLEDNNITNTTVIIEQENINDNIELDNKIDEYLSNDNYLSDRFPLLSKYSENYVSVAKWIISELITEWDTNGFTVDIEDNETEYIEMDGLAGYKTVDGLSIYKDGSDYMTYLLNNDGDIESLFCEYCKDEYIALRYTYLLGKEENKEYDVTASSTLYKELLNYYEKGDFQTIIDKVEELLNNYKFTMPENYDICHIYQDAKLSLDYGDNMEAIYYGLNYMNSVETYFINFMKLSYKDKILLIKDTDSLIPIKGTIVDIEKISEIDLEEYTWLTSQFNDSILNVKSVTEIQYKEYNRDDGNYYSCIAYIANNFDRTHIFLTIKWNDDSQCYLSTAKEYNDFNNNKTNSDEAENIGANGYWNTNSSSSENNNETNKLESINIEE